MTRTPAGSKIPLTLSPLTALVEGVADISASFSAKQHGASATSSAARDALAPDCDVILIAATAFVRIGGKPHGSAAWDHCLKRPIDRVAGIQRRLRGGDRIEKLDRF